MDLNQSLQTPAKIKADSWKLAGAYLICGLIFFFADFQIQPFIQSVFSGFNIFFPFLTKVAFTVGPYGWLLLMTAVSAVVVLNDLKFHARFLNPLFTVFLVLWVGCMAFAFIFRLHLCLAIL